MIYDASIELDRQRAKTRLETLISNEKRFSITVKNPKRSIPQNRYLHLILSWFGLEFGYTMEEVKQEIFKKTVNKDIFYEGEKSGIVDISRWRSTADLDSSEMTLSIDRFRNFSSRNGCYLPEPSDMASINEMERQLEQRNNKEFV